MQSINAKFVEFGIRFRRSSLAVLLVASGFIASCAGPESVVSPMAVEEASILADRRDIILVDVRQPHERESGVPRSAAALVPFDRRAPEPFVAAMRDVVGGDVTRRVALICVVGVRSEAARQALANAGFTRVASVEGGFSRWRAAGLPVRAEVQ